MQLLRRVQTAQGARQVALFTAWRNVRRDLAEACERASIERFSPNDLRRTFASWQVEAGVPLFPIAQATGPKDTRMLERVYGRPLMSDEMKVPGPGIEPGTRGFSGLVGEWPRPRDPLEKRRARAATEAALCQAEAGSGQLSLFMDDE